MIYQLVWALEISEKCSRYCNPKWVFTVLLIVYDFLR